MALASSKDKQSHKVLLIEKTLQQSENLGLIAPTCFLLIAGFTDLRNKHQERYKPPLIKNNQIHLNPLNLDSITLVLCLFLLWLDESL